VKKALRAYEEAQQLASSDHIGAEVWTKLASDDRPVMTSNTTSKNDVAGPFLHKLPAKMEAMKGLPKLAYTSAREGLAEKFHMSEDLLSALNPGRHFDRAGETIAVIDTGADPNPEKAAKVEVDKSRQTVRLFDNSNALIGFYPATVGSEEKPSPVGTLKVTEIDRNPTYYYHPEYHFKGVHSSNRGRTIPWARCGSICPARATASTAPRSPERCPSRSRTAAFVSRIGTPNASPNGYPRERRSTSSTPLSRILLLRQRRALRASVTDGIQHFPDLRLGPNSMMTCPCGQRFDSHDPSGNYVHREHIYATHAVGTRH
jgi:lipoprotein-anchoring transpeptidase ErfK/SrfK